MFKRPSMYYYSGEISYEGGWVHRSQNNYMAIDRFKGR
jgi:hypothetical protein